MYLCRQWGFLLLVLFVAGIEGKPQIIFFETMLKMIVQCLFLELHCSNFLWAVVVPYFYLVDDVSILKEENSIIV